MKKITALSILCASIVPFAAHAEEHSEGHAENYVGVSVSKLTAAPRSNGVAVMLGRRYSEHLAAEVAYSDSSALSSVPEKTTALSVAVVGILPINADFEAYGRLGYASAHSKEAAGFTANHGDITYGVGVEYRLNAKYSLGFGWDHLRVGGTPEIPRANENAYALTVARSF